MTIGLVSGTTHRKHMGLDRVNIVVSGYVLFYMSKFVRLQDHFFRDEFQKVYQSIIQNLGILIQAARMRDTTSMGI
jgi:hypothetical protein